MDRKSKLLLGLSQRLELPSELLVGGPCVELKGNNELTVVGHRGILGYDAACILVGTTLGPLRIEGSGLRIFRMNRERIVIYGRIGGLFWKEAEECSTGCEAGRKR